MQKPPISIEEPSRISDLNNLGILDADPEENFGLLTRLTARIFNVPISPIGLVDTERQWFKSKYSLDQE